MTGLFVKETGMRTSALVGVLSKHLPRANSLQGQRSYHSRLGCYGYRIKKEPTKVKDSKKAIRNRNDNANLLRMVTAYRRFGHRNADIDPLKLLPRITTDELELATYGFEESDPTKHSILGILYPDSNVKEADVATIYKHVNDVYCGKVGVEFFHLPSTVEREWFAAKLENWSSKSEEKLSNEDRLHMHELLAQSETFDRFMQKKFGQVKRYGAEGAESMMVGFDQICRRSAQKGVEQIVLCMPHRGRLNLLMDCLDFPKEKYFHKLAGNPEIATEYQATCDVISHLFCSKGFDFGTDKNVYVSMIPNPSHLEACNPVAVGKARAKQMLLMDHDYKDDLSCNIGDKVMCLQFHGDAAFSAQGIISETLQLSNLPHYSTGGSVHIIVNNQLGFTTAADRGRSSMYASDAGKIIDCPVIHVNGDYPEEVAKACRIAIDYRMQFRKDVIVDIVCFRRWGHNELDDPSFTQPLMYNIIKKRKSVPEKYEQELIESGILTKDQASSKREDHWTELEEALQNSVNYAPTADAFKGNWAGLKQASSAKNVYDTGVDIETMKFVGKASVQVPKSASIHPRLKKGHVDARIERIEKTGAIDWPTAEAIAVGSLLLEDKNVRISGQDVGRGTFSHRHFMLVDQKDDSCYVPLNTMSEKQNFLEIANSELSEFAVLGFEYGMSIENPNGLYIWEAQFGDFFNGAQIILDTFVSNGETKWMRQSGLVVLLPHGFDGAGPEHSSCRIERFLQMTDSSINGVDGEDVNMYVANPSTPAQYFHILRRQMVTPFRKPLVMAGPKTLLRLSSAVSSLEEMGPGTFFKPVIGDDVCCASEVKKVILCSGKVYYDLDKKRKDEGRSDVAIVRVEELCPFPANEIAREMAKFPANAEKVWVQEEPENMGSFSFVLPRFETQVGSKLGYIGRKASAAATGVGKVHKEEARSFMETAFIVDAEPQTVNA
eukprot:Nk52_evm58s164 gene=Nk52_evmTU58s164